MSEVYPKEFKIEYIFFAQWTSNKVKLTDKKLIFQINTDPLTLKSAKKK